MANLGFRQAMAAAGVKLVETDVGDRYVLEALEKGGWSLGGEQSGHVIFRDLATTGDGTLTGLQLLDVMVRTGTAAGRAGVGGRPAAAGAAQRGGGRPLFGKPGLSTATTGWRRPSPRSGTSWAKAGGC